MTLTGDNGSINIIVNYIEDHNSSDYWDANWFNTTIRCDLPGINATFDANIHVDEFKLLLFNLEKLYNNEIREFNLTTIEEILKINFKTTEYSGAINISGTLYSSDFINSLSFNFNSDNPTLYHFIGEIAILFKNYNIK